jgi:pterin-4a-carbinolamine dehydratase
MVSLTSHDEGNVITEKDRKMAEGIDRIFERYLYRK